MDYDLGYFDLETRVLEPLEKIYLPQKCYLCSRYIVFSMFAGWTRVEVVGHFADFEPPSPTAE